MCNACNPRAGFWNPETNAGTLAGRFSQLVRDEYNEDAIALSYLGRLVQVCFSLGLLLHLAKLILHKLC